MQAILLSCFSFFQDISSAKSLMGYTQVTLQNFDLFLIIINESAEILTAVRVLHNLYANIPFQIADVHSLLKISQSPAQRAASSGGLTVFFQLENILWLWWSSWRANCHLTGCGKNNKLSDDFSGKMQRLCRDKVAYGDKFQQLTKIKSKSNVGVANGKMRDLPRPSFENPRLRLESFNKIRAGFKNCL